MSNNIKIDKPVIILFNGFGSSKLWWNYSFIGTSTLEKNEFLSKLQKIGDVFSFNYNFFNINYYSKSDSKKENDIWKKIYKKYKPHTSDIDFNLEDLDYKTICKNVYKKVISKYGTNRKYVVIGHSYGSSIALLFSKMFKSNCLLCAAIDTPPYILDFFKKHDSHAHIKDVNKYFADNASLQKILKFIKNNKGNANKEIDLVYKLIEYNSCIDRIKYYDKNMHIPTLFFRAFSTIPDTKWKKEINKYSIQEKDFLENNNKTNMLKYYVMLDADHYIWKKPEYRDMIIYEILNYVNLHEKN